MRTDEGLACCSCFSRRSTKRNQPAASSRDGGSAVKDLPQPSPKTTATLKPLTGRRSRQESPLPDGEQVEEAPLKRQNSMGDDAGLVTRSPGRGDAPRASGTRHLQQQQHTAAQESEVSSSTQQQMSSREQPYGRGVFHAASGSEGGAPPGSPRHLAEAEAALLHGCPPYGTKSVIGRRPKMEDACVAVPYLAEVPVLAAALDELLPPRIAPQLRSSAGTSPTDAATALELRLSAGMRRFNSGRRGSGSGSMDAVETLHFFGVFDGHGGADAALHCARTLHERVRQVLSACVAVHGGPEASGGRSGPQQETPQFSSSGYDQSQPGTAAMDIPDLPGSSAAASYRDPSVPIGLRPSTSSGNSSSNFLEVEETGEGEGNKVEGVACTTETIEAALTKAFHMTDEEFGNMGGYEHLALVGTTAVVALLGTRMIYVANCGDSRAVLSRNGAAVPLTDDHKAAREDETARVEAAGGQILFWNGVRVMGLLAVSRAIGDHSLRPYVIAEPEVTIINRHPSDELLVMASDGLWDVMTNQEACTLAKKCLQRARQRGSSRQSAARVAATVLTRAAVDRGSRDNVTVVIVDLSPATDAELAAEAAERRRAEERSTSGEQASGAQDTGDISPLPSRGLSGRILEHSDSSSRRRGQAHVGGIAAEDPGPPPHAPPPAVQPHPPPAAPAPSPFSSAPAAPQTTPASPRPAASASPFSAAVVRSVSAEDGEGEENGTGVSASASGSGSGSGSGENQLRGGPSAQRSYTALVSPFASGALPEGLDFDVEGHAKKVAEATAGLGRGQQHNKQQSSSGEHRSGSAGSSASDVIEPMLMGK